MHPETAPSAMPLLLSIASLYAHAHTHGASAQVLSTTLTARLAERYGAVVSGYACTSLRTVRAIGPEEPDNDLDLREDERRKLERNIGAFIQAASGHATIEEALRFLPRELPCPRVELFPIAPNDERRWAPGSGTARLISRLPGLKAVVALCRGLAQEPGARGARLCKGQRLRRLDVIGTYAGLQARVASAWKGPPLGAWRAVRGKEPAARHFSTPALPRCFADGL